MRMFDPVAIACDAWSWDLAFAIRGALELFRLRVYLHYCAQRRNALDFLAGHIPEAEYVVLCCHGLGGPYRDDEAADGMRMGFTGLVDLVGGKWEGAELAITPESIPSLVSLPGRKVVTLGCGSGRGPLARAFLASGCSAYIGPISPVNQDATTMFAISFFYHLLREERDLQPCTDREAVALAAGFDTASKEGTHVFRYYAAT
jgi:hypothetical protein